MIPAIVIYLMFVSDYEKCQIKTELKCQQIVAYCPQVKHYPYIRTTKDLTHEANMCYMTANNTKLFKDYERKTKELLNEK